MIKDQDIIILLMLCLADKTILQKDIADRAKISRAATSIAINRLVDINLLAADRQQVMKRNFMDFLIYGMPYVFPAKLGAVTKGIATHISAEPLKKFFSATQNFVWPYASGKIVGQSIKPIYHSVPDIIGAEVQLYEALTLIDALRIGQAREKKKAISLLKKLLRI